MGSAGKDYSLSSIQNLEQGLSLEDVESAKIVLFNRSFKNSSFIRRESLIYSQNEAPSVSGIFYDDYGRKGNCSTDTLRAEEPVFTISRGSEKSKPSRVSRDLKYRTQSNDSLEEVGDNLFLKKTDETINFSFENVGPDMTDTGIQCAAERLRLGGDRKSSGEVTTRSDLFFSDNLLGELNVDSQEDEIISYDKISQSYIPFQTHKNTIEEPNKLVTETKEEKNIKALWSKNFPLNKSQIVAFFGRKQPPKERKRKLEESDFLQVQYLDAPVSPQEDLITKQYIRRFYFYVLQLILLTSIAMSMVSVNTFYLTSVVSKLFCDTLNISITDNSSTLSQSQIKMSNLRQARTIEDFWLYAETTLIQLLYRDFYKVSTNPNLDVLWSDENQILGVTRLRQVRVTSSSCKIHTNVRRYFDACYGYYTIFDEDTSPIKRDMDGKITTTAWKYTEASDLDTMYYWGEMSIYGGGGYYIDLSKKIDEARKMIQELKENSWLTKATRALFIDFNIYNANVNLFCICKIVLEFPPVGGIILLPDFQTLKLIRYLTPYDFFILGCEFLYALFVVYETSQIIKNIYFEGFIESLLDFWNYLDILLLILSYLYIILSIVRYIYVSRLLNKLDNRHNQYTDFLFVKRLQITFNNVIATLLFFSWVKLFSFFNMTTTMVQFRKTLHKSIRDMFLFFPMFLTMLSAFAFLAYLLFGHEVKQYNSIWHSYLGLLQAFLGEFSFKEVFEANRVLGPIFYIAFVFFVFFVLLNVFIAIINDAYMHVKSQVLPNSPTAGTYIRRGLINIFTCGRPRKKTKPSRAVRKKLLFMQIQKALRRAGFKHEEIEIFFHKYDINCKNFLEEKTKTRIMKDLELKRIEFSETSEQFQINVLRRRLDEYRERMDDWETKLQPVIDKIDILMHRI